MSPNLAGMLQRYLRTPEAARFVGLSIRTLEKHRIYGTGPRYSKLGGRVVYRVEDLHGLLTALRSEGCNVLEKIDDTDYGKFGWVIDPEGNKVELWQPPAGQ